jgi:uncharacterized protein (DUF3820 family)
MSCLPFYFRGSCRHQCFCRDHFYIAPMQPDKEILLSLVTMKMPFGKYKGKVLCDLPVSYLEWFARKGFPQGKLGMQLQTIYEIRINGLESLLAPLKQLRP